MKIHKLPIHKNILSSKINPDKLYTILDLVDDLGLSYNYIRSLYNIKLFTLFDKKNNTRIYWTIKGKDLFTYFKNIGQ